MPEAKGLPANGGFVVPDSGSEDETEDVKQSKEINIDNLKLYF